MARSTQVPSRPSMPDRKALADMLAEFRSTFAAPGIGIDISVNGERSGLAMGLATVGQTQRLTTRSRFRIACTVKFFVALLCLKFAEDGVFDLDAPIGQYLPELGRNGASKGATITVRHLLTHTAGYRGIAMRDRPSRGDWTWQHCASFLENAEQLFPPGTVFNEEHIDHVIVGQILRKLTGRSLGDLFREMIFDPLAIRPGTIVSDSDLPDIYVDGHTFSPLHRKAEKKPFDNPPSELWSASFSSITMTARDLGTIAAQFVLNGPNTLSQMWHFPALAAKACHIETIVPVLAGTRLNPNWALSAFTVAGAHFSNGFTGYFGTGSGQLSALIFAPESKIGMALTINSEAPPLRTIALDAALDLIYRRQGPSMQERANWPPIKRDFDDFLASFDPDEVTGYYTGNARDPIAVSQDDGRLVFRISDSLKVAVHRGKNNVLMIEDGTPVPLCFFADPTTGVPCLLMGMNAFRKTASLS